MFGSTIAKTNPQLVEDVEAIPQKAMRMVSDNLPKLAEAARETGRSVVNSVADIAGSATSNLQQAMPTGDAIKATTVAVATTAALQAVQRFAVRRPIMFVLGGLAVVGILASARRRAGAASDADRAADEGAMGEGSYQGRRDYRDRTKAFLKKEGSKVTRKAKDAKAALEGSERDELEAAEAEGLSHARS